MDEAARHKQNLAWARVSGVTTILGVVLAYFAWQMPRPQPDESLANVSPSVGTGKADESARIKNSVSLMTLMPLEKSSVDELLGAPLNEVQSQWDGTPVFEAS